MVKLDELWEQLFQEDLPECSHEEQWGSLRVDCQFLEIVKGTVELVDDHSIIGLPLKNGNGNNHKLVEQCAVNLKRRFERDALFHADYVSFMHNIISCS